MIIKMCLGEQLPQMYEQRAGLQEKSIQDMNGLHYIVCSKKNMSDVPSITTYRQKSESL